MKELTIIELIKLHEFWKSEYEIFKKDKTEENVLYHFLDVIYKIKQELVARTILITGVAL